MRNTLHSAPGAPGSWRGRITLSLSRKSTIIGGVALAVFALDRYTKQLVTGNVELGGSINVVDGFFDLTYVRNLGAAFGFLSLLDSSYRVPFFATTTLAAVCLLLYFAHKTEPGNVLLLVSLALVTGGALGNLADRLMYGYVVDFIDWYIGSYHWPAFNIADSAITAGIAIMGEEIIIRKKL